MKVENRKISIEKEARRLGANLFGVVDLDAAKALDVAPADLFDGYTYALVVGLTLPDGPVDQCSDGPTPLYHHAYAVCNQKLDSLSYGLANFVAELGGRGLPLPASKLLDIECLSSNVSYKALGRLAGLGWQGKSLLLVNPDHGPRFRMGVVLTDLEVAPDSPIKNRCGSCTECAKACPAGAIKNVSTEDFYPDRDVPLDFSKCADMCMKVFTKRPHIEKPICGVCIRACPWGRPNHSAGHG